MAARGRPRSFDREEALRKAMRVFWARGYEGATMAELTGAMGIGSPSLYAAFGSKEALFREAVELYARTEGLEIWNALPEAPTAREAIERFLLATAEAYSRKEDPAGCLIVLGALTAHEGNEAACRDLRERRVGNVEELRVRLSRAVADGELPAGLDCAAVARFYATVQQGMSIQARDGATREQLQAIARSAMAAWDGLTGRRGGSCRYARGEDRTDTPSRESHGR